MKGNSLRNFETEDGQWRRSAQCSPSTRSPGGLAAMTSAPTCCSVGFAETAAWHGSQLETARAFGTGLSARAVEAMEPARVGLSESSEKASRGSSTQPGNLQRAALSDSIRFCQILLAFLCLGAHAAFAGWTYAAFHPTPVLPASGAALEAWRVGVPLPGKHPKIIDLRLTSASILFTSSGPKASPCPADPGQALRGAAQSLESCQKTARSC